jgi:hypothetical protein
VPKPISPALRERLFAGVQQGLPTGQLASSLRLAERTARRLVSRFRNQPEGPEGVPLAPDYSRCGRPCPVPYAPLRQHCLLLRRQHPAWGAPRLLLELKKLHPGVSLPCPRTLQLWLDDAGLSTPRPVIPQHPLTQCRATAVHEVWQMDAAEHMRLHSGQEVSWLRIADEYSSAVLATFIFPPGALAAGARW